MGWTLFFVSLAKMAVAPSAAKRHRTPLTMHQRWIVSLGAILAERTPGHSHTILYPLKRVNATMCKMRLKESWDITGPDSLDSTLGWLATEGHRMAQAQVIGHPPMAWDMCRYVDIVRHGFGAGYIDEADAWQRLSQVPAMTARTYSSWRAYADDFMAGRQLWMRGLAGTEHEAWPVSQDETGQAVQRLLDPVNAASPWQHTPWDAIYRPDSP